MLSEQERRYHYFSSRDPAAGSTVVHRETARQLSEERAEPGLRNPDYLVLRERTRIFKQWLARIGKVSRVLDIGGRIQPYRSFLTSGVGLYVAIDPVLEGLVNVVAVGERLPFPGGYFELALCTQVLNYVKDPSLVIGEVYRVLRPGGYLLLSAPALFPRHHDERWRFLPNGLRVLLEPFARVEIVPEGHSVAGVCRTINSAIAVEDRHWRVAGLLRSTVVPAVNCVGLCFDNLSKSERLTANYSVLARK